MRKQILKLPPSGASIAGGGASISHVETSVTVVAAAVAQSRPDANGFGQLTL